MQSMARLVQRALAKRIRTDRAWRSVSFERDWMFRSASEFIATRTQSGSAFMSVCW